MGLAENPFFQCVRAHADFMLEHGRDSLGDPPAPLFAAVIDVHLLKQVPWQVDHPPGVRPGDVSWSGNNLMHDIPFLEALRALTRLTGESRYEDAADEELEFYGHNCPHPATGLFPWGEHAEWRFTTKSPAANSTVLWDPDLIIHDHLHFAPEWFWGRLWEESPEAVIAFARGLDGHIVNRETFEHCRHAPIQRHRNLTEPKASAGTDFARHAGFYIFDCLYAYKHSRDEGLLEWARRKLAWHTDRRHPNGIIPGCARTEQEAGEGQHDKLALCVLDAGTMVGEDTVAGREFADVGRELLAARAALDQRSSPVPEQPAEICAWGWAYSASTPSCYHTGLLHKQLYDRTGIQWYADSVVEQARLCAKAAPPPERFPTIAWDFWGNMALPLAAYVLSGDETLLKRAATVGQWALQKLVRKDVIMGASNMQHVLGGYYAGSERPGFYYSCTGTPSLVRGLLRLALLQEGQEDVLGTDTHFR